MRRLLAIFVALVSAGVLIVMGTGASDEGEAYRVRAIFDSAFSVIPGEDVKVAGVKVGKIEKLDVTKSKQAAVVLRIDKPGFGDFRSDAECTIRPQSLIGEKFVECTPTQPRGKGDPLPPPLKEIPEGEDGAGEFLLPSSQTSRPVDIDLLNNVLRMPYRQRFSIILNEFGTALAGRGKDLNQVIRKADPALRETDKVVKILADENNVLQDLARDGDTVLQPLAERRADVADFIVQANTVAQATADRRADLEEQFRKFPTFLRELKPTLTRLGALSDEMSPVLEDLGAQAPAISRFIMELGPFSESARPALRSLGDAADVGRTALVRGRPLIKDLRAAVAQARPLTDDLEAILTSFKDTGGIERLMDYLFFQVAAVNGFDSLGHYLRAGLIVNTCTSYAVEPTSGCEAAFPNATARATASGPKELSVAGRTPALVRQDAVTRGMSVEEAYRRFPDEKAAGRRAATSTPAPGSAGRDEEAKKPLHLPAAVLPVPQRKQAGASANHGAESSPGVASAQEGMLDYLLGNGS